MVRVRRRPQQTKFLRWATLSFLVHGALIAFFTFNPWPVLIRTQPLVYTVTLMSVSFPEREIPRAEAMQKPKEAPPQPPPPKPIEKKPIEKTKKDDIIEKVKPAKKVQKAEMPKPPEEPKVDEKTLRELQKALEEIRKKAALEEIQKRVAKRERTEKPAPATPAAPPSKVTSTAPPSAERWESKLNEYYGLIWAKIKEEWTIPENLLKDMVDLETIIVIIIERDGKIQRSWFEKKSGNDMYDQMALRAILKADPLPSIPKELTERTLEVGIRFVPD